MPQMGPMSWVSFLFVILILMVIFVVMIHDSKLESSKWEEKSSVNWSVKKW